MKFLDSLFNNKYLKYINKSKIFGGLILLSLNLFSKFISVKLSENQEEFIRNSFGRQILIFSIAWLGTRDIITALGLTAIFVILADNFFNENSDMYILPKKIKKAIDTNSDGIISEKEIETAINVLNKAKKQQNRLLNK
ncbi:MAG: hypothetical protein CMF80_06665 [Candidatus Marinimicrobia bacterium]|nr:hypothetical protein [Candidatus Neomarinimicrobiota bacterium]|tara:strand:+ start:171 stop:587 length:417 start_codon:yes stop_codon:yes gene_type:complete